MYDGRGEFAQVPVNYADPRGLDRIDCSGNPEYEFVCAAGGGGTGSGSGGECEPPLAQIVPMPNAPCRGGGGPWDARADFRDYAVKLSNDASKSDCEKLALMAYKAGQNTQGAGATIEMLQSGLTERSGRLGTSDPNYRVGVFKSTLASSRAFRTQATKSGTSQDGSLLATWRPPV